MLQSVQGTEHKMEESNEGPSEDKLGGRRVAVASQKVCAASKAQTAPPPRSSRKVIALHRRSWDARFLLPRVKSAHPFLHYLPSQLLGSPIRNTLE